MKPKLLILLSLTFLLELSSCGVLFTSWSFPKSMGVFIAIHGSACVALAWLLQVYLPVRYKSTKYLNLLFFISIGFFMPFIGLLGLGTIVFYSLYQPKTKIQRQWVITGDTNLPAKSTLNNTRLLQRRGSLIEILEHSTQIDKRINSIIRTRQMRDQDAIPVLRMALKDSEDEVRLLAYALLDRKEKVINTQINDLLNKLENAPPESRPELHIRVAQGYWELVYTGLVQGIVLQHVLKSALLHARKAIAEKPYHRGLHLLTGRILLRLGDLEKSQTHFERARKLGIPSSDILPYLAEIAFMRKDFNNVQNCLRFLDPMTRNSPPISSVAAYWK